jgi:hypothetical protein
MRDHLLAARQKRNSESPTEKASVLAVSEQACQATAMVNHASDQRVDLRSTTARRRRLSLQLEWLWLSQAERCSHLGSHVDSTTCAHNVAKYTYLVLAPKSTRDCAISAPYLASRSDELEPSVQKTTTLMCPRDIRYPWHFCFTTTSSLKTHVLYDRTLISATRLTCTQRVDLSSTAFQATPGLSGSSTQYASGYVSIEYG